MIVHNKQQSMKLFSVLGTIRLLGDYVQENYIELSQDTIALADQIGDIVHKPIFDDISMMNATPDEVAEFVEGLIEELLNEVKQIEHDLNQNT